MLGSDARAHQVAAIVASSLEGHWALPYATARTPAGPSLAIVQAMLEEDIALRDAYRSKILDRAWKPEFAEPRHAPSLAARRPAPTRGTVVRLPIR
jgi:hypothetical protein